MLRLGGLNKCIFYQYYALALKRNKYLEGTRAPNHMMFRPIEMILRGSSDVCKVLKRNINETEI